MTGDRDTSVKVEGLAQLIRSLKDAGKGVEDLKEANQNASRIVLNDAQSRAPSRTGALVRSGRINKAAKKANVLFGNARVPYAGPIHWGWPARNIKANPFVVDAADATQPEWLAEYERDIQDLLDDVKGA